MRARCVCVCLRNYERCLIKARMHRTRLPLWFVVACFLLCSLSRACMLIVFIFLRGQGLHQHQLSYDISSTPWPAKRQSPRYSVIVPSSIYRSHPANSQTPFAHIISDAALCVLLACLQPNSDHQHHTEQPENSILYYYVQSKDHTENTVRASSAKGLAFTTQCLLLQCTPLKSIAHCRGRCWPVTPRPAHV